MGHKWVTSGSHPDYSMGHWVKWVNRCDPLSTLIRKVYITPDLTPREQQHNKALRACLAEMNKDGKKYLIKNGRIVQRGG